VSYPPIALTPLFLDSLQDKFFDNEIGKEDYNQLKAKYTSELEKLTREKLK
jgi:hypothetical protein